MKGLDASEIEAPSAPKRKIALVVCLECGNSFERGARVAEFCSRECRKAHNNRRMTRGALLYDLVMVMRYEREVATKFKVWRTINRLAKRFREEDERERGGRRSWRKITLIARDRLYLWATTGRW